MQIEFGKKVDFNVRKLTVCPRSYGIGMRVPELLILLAASCVTAAVKACQQFSGYSK